MPETAKYGTTVHKVGIPHVWTALTLFRARTSAELTQAQLADLAGIDRSRYNGLERGLKRLTPYYAAKISPHVNKTVEELLEPKATAKAVEGPYDLLRRLAETVEKQQVTIDALQSRVEGLERGASKRRRSSAGGQ